MAEERRGGIDVDALLAEHDSEKPAQKLGGLPGVLVSVAAVGLTAYAIFWVLSPQPALPYRIVLPGRRAVHDLPGVQGEQPGRRPRRR